MKDKEWYHLPEGTSWPQCGELNIHEWWLHNASVSYIGSRALKMIERAIRPNHHFHWVRLLKEGALRVTFPSSTGDKTGYRHHAVWMTGWTSSITLSNLRPKTGNCFSLTPIVIKGHMWFYLLKPSGNSFIVIKKCKITLCFERLIFVILRRSFDCVVYTL